jgi:hypothetical protein
MTLSVPLAYKVEREGSRAQETNEWRPMELDASPEYGMLWRAVEGPVHDSG